jgi:hypothetical protein
VSLAVLAFVGSAAQAMVTTVGPTKVGLQPREAGSVFEGTPTVASFNNPEGNPVLHKNETYAIYWDPTDHYHGDWQHLIDTFFQGLGADSGSTGTVFAVDSQYTDKSDLPASYLSTFRGAYTDTDPYPVGASNCKDPHPLEIVDRIGPGHTEVCLTDAQVPTELKAFVAAHGLSKGVGSIFYLLTPPAVTVCLDAGGPTGHCSDHTGSIEETGTESYKNSFCSYHSDFSNVTLENATTPDANTILYGVIPWSAGGRGDYHLVGADETSAYDCQDGGFDPTTKPIEKKEKAKEKKIESIKEKEEKTRNPQEQKEQEEAELKAAILEGPHEQEPNQSAGRSPDGGYDTGLADLIVSQIGVQQQNIVTDPLLNAWKDSVGNEVTDECRNFFATGGLGGSVAANENTAAGTLYNQSFGATNAYINDAFNLAVLRLPYPGVPCRGSIDLAPMFTAPNQVNTGELVGFDGMESNITLNGNIGYSKTTGAEEAKYASYKWNFGDETPEVTGYAPGAPSLNSPETSPCELPWKAPCAASVYHSYQYGGSHTVTLTVTDVGGNTASVSHAITVDGPPAPSPEPPSGSGPSGSGGAGASPGSPSKATTATPTTPPTPAQVVTGFAAPPSLKTIMKGGLPVRYTTNEQVAGSIQVLLESAVAKRLGVHGAPATGLPKGTPSSIVVGTAVLVTTRAGQGTIRIKFSARTASRLKHTRKLKLMLRLFARNASRQSPQTTTALSTVVLNP